MIVSEALKFIPALQLNIFTDIYAIKIKSVDLCSNCNKKPTGKKKKELKCCEMYKPSERVRKKSLLDANIILNIG